MNPKSKIVLAVVVGAALGGATVHGLHAQAKPKAYLITENEVIDAAAQQAYTPVIQAAQKAAGARLFNTGGGKIVAFAGDPPKRVTITEWDSLEAVVAFRTGKAWKDLSPQRDKALKVHRSYAVEATR